MSTWRRFIAARASEARASAAAGAAAYAERFRTVCAACHGDNGRSDTAGVPVLAGQYSLYAITQLFLFREGRRNNEAMIALAKPMKDADLRGFSDYIGTLPPVPAPAPATPPDAARMSKGQALAQEHGANLRPPAGSAVCQVQASASARTSMRLPTIRTG